MARINETRQIVWHETCKCICKLTSAVCNSRQIWNEDKCRCECKEDLINKMVCDKGYIWNPSNFACECHRLCDIGQYLDYQNCVCRKSLVDKLVEQCINVIDGDATYNETLSINPNDCPSRTLYVVLFIVFLSISVISYSLFIFIGHTKINYQTLLGMFNLLGMYKMVTKQINLKNRSYYFWNDQI